MQEFKISGISCSACVNTIEKAVKKIDGVETCSVNFLTNRMVVEGQVNPQTIINAVKKAGYGIEEINKKASVNQVGDRQKIGDNNLKYIIIRLLVSLALFALLWYISMGHIIFKWPIPSFFKNNLLANGVLQMLIAIAILVINQNFFIKGIKALFRLSPNMDTLIAVGSGASFLYSVAVLFIMINEQFLGNLNSVKAWSGELFFESSAMILVLISFGKMLESISKGKTTSAIKSLMDLSPKTARILKDGIEVEFLVSEVKQGDIFIVKPGERIPVDGVVLEGESAIDESALSGESLPVDKTKDSQVFSATINCYGVLKCKATKVGEDTTFSQIIKMVQNASSQKAPIAKIADKVSGFFVPVVMLIAFITVVGWLIGGKTIGFALARGISVLVISCPCALGLATPVAIMVGSGIGAKNGILFKTATSLEETGKAKIVALDKTGTITLGKPQVIDVVAFNDFSQTKLIEYAYALEKNSKHPIAFAINSYANKNGVKELLTSEFKMVSGGGVTAKIDQKTLSGGNLNFISTFANVNDKQKQEANNLASQGKTPIFFAVNDELAGIISVADTIKEDSKLAINELKKLGLKVVMLTGDNSQTAKAVAEDAGVEEYISELLPDGKEQAIKELQRNGKVIMVGDGINDAPALSTADVGIAIGGGTDVAIESADIVLANFNLSLVAYAVRLSKRTLLTIKENLFWAFIYNIIGIPLAMGLFINLLGWQLNPIFAAASMSLSSVCVVLNALRLNLFKNANNNQTLEKNIQNLKKENIIMIKTIIIEGMMCPHCEGRVKSTLEGLVQVESAEVSHQNKRAVVNLKEDLSNDELKQVVEAQGYKVIEIK